MTANQAKVYLVLASSKFSTVKEIQKASNVPRQEIYKILTVLEELGFIEKTLTRPVKFNAIPIQQGIFRLLRNKVEETKELQREAKEIINKYHSEDSNSEIKEYLPNFLLIPGRDASINKRRKEIENTQSGIDFITSWKRFPLTIHTFAEIAEKKLKKNVKIRVILEKPQNLDEMPQKIEDLKKYPNYELRYIFNHPAAVMAIFDGKKAIIDTCASSGLGEAPALWTDNQSLLSVLSDYFEIMWITAMENTPEKICVQ